MNMNFELYEGGEVEWTRGRVHVTLNKHCHLFFSRRAVEALSVTPRGDAPAGAPGATPRGDAPAGNAAGCEAVALLFDKRHKVIGVMSARPGQKHSYTLRAKRGMGGARLITAKGFCKTYGIATRETIAFPDAAVNRDGVLVLDLQKVVAVSRRQ